MLNKATEKQSEGKTIQNCILHESRHQANLIPGTNLCDIPTGNPPGQLWKCWCRDGQDGRRVNGYTSIPISIGLTRTQIRPSPKTFFNATYTRDSIPHSSGLGVLGGVTNPCASVPAPLSMRLCPGGACVPAPVSRRLCPGACAPAPVSLDHQNCVQNCLGLDL